MADKKLRVYCETSLAGLNCPVIITPMDFLARKEELGL